MDLAALKTDLTRDEALRTFPYDDATGKPLQPGDRLVGKLTIGIGHNLTDNGLPLPIIEDLYEHDVAATLGALAFRLPWFPALDPMRQRALVNVAFNVGVGGLLGFRKMLAALAQQDYETAADELLDSDAARKLPARYRRLAQMIRTGKQGAE